MREVSGVKQGVKLQLDPFAAKPRFDDRRDQLRDLLLEVWRVGRVPHRL